MPKILVPILLTLLYVFSFPAAAESGWILVVPPKIQQMTDSEIDWLNKSTAAYEDPVDRILHHGDALLDKAAPIIEWRQVSAFDNVTLCEEDRSLRNRVIERELENVKSMVDEDQDFSLEEFDMLFAISLGRNARCVPASTYYGN